MINFNLLSPFTILKTRCATYIICINEYNTNNLGKSKCCNC